MENTKYLSHDALTRLMAAQGKTVQSVICHLWVNRIDKQAPVELIDNVELHFDKNQKLTISCNESGEALDAINYDFESAKSALEKEFEGKIKLFAVNASTTKMWQDIIGQTLLAVRVIKEGEYHVAGSVLLEFDREKRIISISPTDGLLIDYYED